MSHTQTLRLCVYSKQCLTLITLIQSNTKPSKLNELLNQSDYAQQVIKDDNTELKSQKCD